MKERIRSIDCMRGVAILAVLLIHVTTRTLEASKFDLTDFSLTLFLNQITRFAVPLFFIISGFVLELSFKEESYWSFIKRRFSKIFIPYIFWSAFYYLVIYNNNHDNSLKVILTGNASYQLYFIPALLVFYCTFPFIHKLYKYISNRVFLIAFSLFEVGLLYINYYVKAFDLGDSINVMILGYFFFVIGIIAARNKDKIDIFVKKTRTILTTLMLFGGIYIFWEGRNGYLMTHNYLTYYSQWRPSVLIYTILVCLTLYYYFEHTRLQGLLISRFSKHSFLVFFIHVAVLETFWLLLGKNLFIDISGTFVGKLVFDPIFFGAVASISFLLAYLLHKIPKLRHLIG